MNKLPLLLLALFMVGCRQSNAPAAYKLDAMEYGESWMKAFELLGSAGLKDPDALQDVRKEFQPQLDRLKSVSGDEKKIYDEALFLDRAFAYLSENANKPPGQRYTDAELNKALGIKEGKLPEDPSKLANAFGELLIRYMKLCR